MKRQQGWMGWGEERQKDHIWFIFRHFEQHSKLNHIYIFFFFFFNYNNWAWHITAVLFLSPLTFFLPLHCWCCSLHLHVDSTGSSSLRACQKHIPGECTISLTEVDEDNGGREKVQQMSHLRLFVSILTLSTIIASRAEWIVWTIFTAIDLLRIFLHYKAISHRISCIKLSFSWQCGRTLSNLDLKYNKRFQEDTERLWSHPQKVRGCKNFYSSPTYMQHCIEYMNMNQIGWTIGCSKKCVCFAWSAIYSGWFKGPSTPQSLNMSCIAADTTLS